MCVLNKETRENGKKIRRAVYRKMEAITNNGASCLPAPVRERIKEIRGFIDENVRTIFFENKKTERNVLLSGTSNGNRTHDFALRGQRLDRLTMEA